MPPACCVASAAATAPQTKFAVGGDGTVTMKAATLCSRAPLETLDSHSYSRESILFSYIFPASHHTLNLPCNLLEKQTFSIHSTFLSLLLSPIPYKQISFPGAVNPPAFCGTLLPR